MASPRAESHHQGVGQTSHKRKADARARKNDTGGLRVGRERELRAHGKSHAYTRMPHRCSAPIERGGKRGEGEEKRVAAGPGIACGGNGGSSVFAQESRTYTSLSDPICAARGFQEREGEEGGGTWNHSRQCGASIQLRSHLCPAAPMPSAATNPVRLHLHPSARRLVPLLLYPPLRLLVLPVCSQCTYLFLSLPLLYCLCYDNDMDILCSILLPAVGDKQHWLLCSTVCITDSCD
jgi:hypothetical protein